MSRPPEDVLITKVGYDRLRGELLNLITTTRPALAERIRQAREADPDPAENADLMDALLDSAMLEERINEIKDRLGAARVAPPAGDDGVAAIGTRVGLRMVDGEVVHYELVGAGEAEPEQRRISIASPVGEAIAGHRAGDQVDVQTPQRRVRFEVVSVDPLRSDLRRAA